MTWEQVLGVANLVFVGVACIATVGGVAVDIGWRDPNQREIGRLNALREFIERLPVHRRTAFEADFDRRVGRLERRLSAARGAARYWWIAVITLMSCLLAEVLQLILLGPGEGAIWTMPLLASLAALGLMVMFGILLLVPVLPSPIGAERWAWLAVPAAALMYVEALRTDNDSHWVASQWTLVWFVALPWVFLGLAVVALVGYSTLALVPRTRGWLLSRMRSTVGRPPSSTSSLSRPSAGDDEEPEGRNS